MPTELSDRLAKLACEALRELSDEFEDELERRPTVKELMDILTDGIQSSREQLLADVRPADAVSLTAKLSKDGRSRSQDESAVDELNDNVFMLANGLWTDLAHAARGETGKLPTLKALSDVIVAALRDCGGDVVSDVELGDVVGIAAKARRGRGISSEVGDIVAIPAPGGEHFRAVVVAKNDFGTAFGLFKGTGPPERPSTDPPPPVVPHPVYSDDQLVERGTWPVIGHDERLLALFREPEIFHSEQLDPGGPEVGPYGTAESPSGARRDLSEDEARELGLLDHTYSQLHVSEYLPEYLEERYGR